MIWAAEFTVKLVATVEPNVTAVTSVNPVPMTTTVVPPVVGPLVGLRAVTAGPANRCAAFAVITTMATAWALVTELVGCRYRKSPAEAPLTTPL